MHPQNRYVVESNIARYEQHLGSGLLDTVQARIVAELLAEARARLAELEPVDMGLSTTA